MASLEELSVCSSDVKGMQRLSATGCVGAVIPMGMYEGMDQQESAGTRGEERRVEERRVK